MNKIDWISRISALATLILLTTTAAAQSQFPGRAGLDVQIQNSVPPYLPTPSGPKISEVWTNFISYEPTSEKEKVPYVQPDLRIGFKLNYNFTFNLKARDLFGNARQVPDGWYLFTLALVRKDTSMIFNQKQPKDVTERFVTATSPMAVKVTGGEFSEEISLPFDDLRMIALSHLMFVELLPLSDKCHYPSGKKKTIIPCIAVKPNGKADMARSDVSQLRPGFRPYLVQTSFIPFKNKDSSRPVMSDERNPLGVRTLASYVIEARRQRELARARAFQPAVPAQAYAIQNGLRYLDINDPDLKNIAREWMGNEDPAAVIQKLLDEPGQGALTVDESYRRIMPVLCEYMYRNNSVYQNGGIPPRHILRICGQRDAPNVSLARVIHVGKVDTSVEPKFTMAPQLNYNVLNNFIVSRARTRDFSRTFTGKPTAFLAPLFRAVESTGIGVPVDFTYSVGISNNQSKSEAQMTSLGEPMDYNPIGLVFQVANSRSCLQVAVSPLNGSLFYDPAPGAKNGLLICGNLRRQMQVEELYAHIFTAPHDSSVNTAYSEVSQTLNVSLRGDRDMTAFLVQIRGHVTPVHSPDIFPSTTTAAVQKYFAGPMASANVISNPIGFAKGYEPSLIQMGLWQYREKFIGDQASR